MSLDQDVQNELNSAAGGFYQPHKTLAVGQSEVILITRYAKNTQTKYPIKDKAGTSLGYTWRFFLEDGKVWDVSNRNRKVLMQGLHPNGQDGVVPARFKVTNIGNQGTKGPAQEVVCLGSVQAGEDADGPLGV